MRKREQQSEQRSRCADGRRHVGRRVAANGSSDSKSNRQPAAYAADRVVVLQEECVPQRRSSSTPNIQMPSMLNRMCSAPAVEEHVRDELPDPAALDHPLRGSARSTNGRRERNRGNEDRDVDDDDPLDREVIGPGPKE